MVDYRPIPCADHERLEFAALRGLSLRLTLTDGGQLEGHVLDVYARAGAEWLRFRDVSGTEHVLRLDALASFSEIQRA